MNGQTSLQGWTIIPMPQTMQHKADIALLPMCGRINEARAVGDDRHILAVQLIDDIRAATGLTSPMHTRPVHIRSMSPRTA